LDPGSGRKSLSKEPRFTDSTTYPDATDWTISDVADFFISAGFLEQAEIFRDQVDHHFTFTSVFIDYFCISSLLVLVLSVWNLLPV